MNICINCTKYINYSILFTIIANYDFIQYYNLNSFIFVIYIIFNLSFSDKNTFAIADFFYEEISMQGLSVPIHAKSKISINNLYRYHIYNILQ